MNDILIATLTKSDLSQIRSSLMQALKSFGLQVALEKVQWQPPQKYLGLKIMNQTIQPQTIQLSTKIQNLNNVQKVLCLINWLRPYLGLTTPQLAPFFNLLKGDSDLNSPRKLTPEAKATVETVEQTITDKSTRYAHKCVLLCLFSFLIFILLVL